MNTTLVKHRNLLNYLEEQGADVSPGCRDGFCGSCRYPKSELNVSWFYGKDPIACYDDNNEVITCCAYLTTLPTPPKVE